MSATEILKKNSNIETAALAKAFSRVLLSHPTIMFAKLKSEVSKGEKNLNESILSNRIYVDTDTNVL